MIVEVWIKEHPKRSYESVDLMLYTCNLNQVPRVGEEIEVYPGGFCELIKEVIWSPLENIASIFIWTSLYHEYKTMMENGKFKKWKK